MLYSREFKEGTQIVWWSASINFYCQCQIQNH